MTPLTANDPTSVGPFRLLGVLGSGGMGRVYLGESPVGRRVAIKVIRADLAEDPAFRRRFQREVTAARTVSPLYTAAVVDADTAATAPWFATAYIDGPSLLTLVEDAGPLASGAVLTLAAGLAEGLASIHEAGLVHRDLAPGNVILDDSGPHIIDFGIALDPRATKLTADQRLVGTPSYIAPEVIEGGNAGPPSDVFALGAILAFAATGKHLVADGPLHAQILQIIRARFDLEAIPKEIRPLVVRCTAAKPQSRPTAAELLRMLIGSGVAKPSPGWFTSTATAPPIKLPPQPGRFSRRGLLVTAGVAGLAAAAAGAAAWAGAFTSTPAQNATPSSPATGSPTPRPAAPSRSGPGTIAWRARSGARPVGLSSVGPQSPTRIIIDRGERLIAANSSEVFAVGLDGRRRWTETLPTGLVNLRAWGDGVLVNDLRRLWLLDAATGEVTLTINAADDEGTESQGDNPDGVPVQITGVALSPDAAFVGLGTATIAFDRTGQRLWRRPRPDRRNGVRPPEGAPVATRDRWLVTHDQSGSVVHVSLRDAGDGALQWLARYEESAVSPPPPGGPGSGRPGSTDESWYRTEGRITPDHIVLRHRQEVRVFALAGGETVWSGASQTPIVGIEVVGDTVLVAADRLRAFEVATQAQLWEHDARGARVAVTEGGTSIFVASDEGLSLVDVDGRRLWFEPYPSYLASAAPDWVGVAGELGYVTFRSTSEQRDPLEFDVIAVRLGPPA